MKDGYIQTKISELDEHLKQIKNEVIKLGLQLQSFEKRLGDYDNLLGKLDDLEKFRKDVHTTLVKENESLLNNFQELLVKDLYKNVVVAVDLRMKEINNFLNKIKKETDEINKYKEGLVRFSVDLDREGWILFVLMRQLAKKNIFTDEEMRAIINDANRRHKKNLREHGGK